MRFLQVFLLAISFIALGSSFAVAFNRDARNYAYNGCVCRFGYGSNGCTETVACGSAGGRCVEACKLPSDYSSR